MYFLKIKSTLYNIMLEQCTVLKVTCDQNRNKLKLGHYFIDEKCPIINKGSRDNSNDSCFGCKHPKWY